ncbi:MAG: amino acid racemase [Ezakiella sp.]|nr:amino acid racemase [Ezakiella sp.]MDD7471345.1 amino acid racemase [Bacillota bacterium]MDY3923560.1 amino acid racemase [Ezakiella sp.]
MKKMCIVGGMGPLATADCYERIISKSPATKDQEHIETLIISDTLMPDRTQAILSGERDELLKHFENNFKLAKSWGADFIIIPCNTSHYFFDELLKLTDIKLLNMVELACKKANDKTYVLATEGTYKSEIYKKCLEKFGKEYLELTDIEKKISNDTIYKVKSGIEPIWENFPEFEKLVESKKNVGIILACTELSLFTFDEENVIDALDELVTNAIREAYE